MNALRISLGAALTAGFALGLLADASAATITVSSVPATLSASGTSYVLDRDLTFSGGGAAITVTAPNVTLDGAGHTLRYCDTSSSCQGVLLNSVSGVRIQNLVLQQGSSTGTPNTAISGSSSSGIVIDNVKFNLVAKQSAEVYGVRVMTTSAGSEVRNSTFNVTGTDSVESIDNGGSSAWNVHNNTWNIAGLGFVSMYPRIVNVGNYSEYHDNVFTVDGNSHYVNLFVSWAAHDVKIYRNQIDYASHHGRPILLDNGSSNFEVYDNFIRVTSQNSGQDTVYVIRLRSDAGKQGASNNYVHHNTIDASASTQVLDVSIGADTYANANNKFAYNIFKSSASPIEFYGDYASNTDFYCNQIVHTASDSGFPVTVNGSLHSGVRFDSNLVTTKRADQIKVDFLLTPAASSSWFFNNTGITASNIGGKSASSALSLLDSSQMSLDPSCYQQAGASTTRGIPNAPAGLSVN
jgi:hypothetical protein